MSRSDRQPMQGTGAALFAGALLACALAVGGRAPAAVSAPASTPVPVCTNGGMPAKLIVPAGVQASGRMVFYCPQGAATLSLLYSGAMAQPSGEIDLVDRVAMRIALEVDIPKPYEAARAYAAGQTVTFATTPGQRNPTWLATGAVPPGLYPRAGSVLWTAGPVPARLVAVTCGGQPVCLLATPRESQGVLVTDPVAVDCPVGCWIAVREHIMTSGVQRIARGLAQQAALGPFLETGPATADPTRDPASLGLQSGPETGTIGPLGLIGTPRVRRPTVCILGDSRSAGSADLSVVALHLTAGGAGYTQADVGRVLALTAGQGTGAMGSPARLIVEAVNGGQGTGPVTAVRLFDQGQYNNPVHNPGFPLPVGVQAVAGGGGAGLAVAPTFDNTGGEFGDAYGAVGSIQRALSANGYGWIGFTTGGDSFEKYAARDATRLALATASGCSSAIVELGINDVGLLRPLSAMQADAAHLVRQLHEAGIAAVFLTTLPPIATSKDGYTTLAGQTTHPGNAIRVAWNGWVRSAAVRAIGLAGTFEIADTVESARDSGLWAADPAVPCRYTCGQTHSGAAGYAAQAAGVVAGLAMLR